VMDVLVENFDLQPIGFNAPADVAAAVGS